MEINAVVVFILLNALVVSLFCMGLWTITDEGKLLHFIRKPFIQVQDKLNAINIRKENFEICFPEMRFPDQMEIDWMNFILKVFKPILLCPPCMGSFWGFIIYSINNGFPNSFYEVATIIIICVIASFLNYLFHAVYDRA